MIGGQSAENNAISKAFTQKKETKVAKGKGATGESRGRRPRKKAETQHATSSIQVLKSA